MTQPISFTDVDAFIRGNENNTKTPEQNAIILVTKLNERRVSNIEQIEKQVDAYKNVVNNRNNVQDLLSQYMSESVSLNKQLKNSSSDILTNNRKTYYKDQQNYHLDLYYYVMIIIYVIVLVYFIVMSFIYNSYDSRKIALFVVFIALPFISTFLLKSIYEFLSTTVFIHKKIE